MYEEQGAYGTDILKPLPSGEPNNKNTFGAQVLSHMKES